MQQPENPFVTINEFLLSIEREIDDLRKSQTTANDDGESTKLMTIDEASKFLNLSKSSIYSKTSTRQIPFIKKGKQLYFIKSDLLDWVTKGRKETSQTIKDTPLDQLLRPLKK